MTLRKKIILLSAVASLAALLSLPLLFPFPWERLDRHPASVAVYDREGNLLRLTRGEGDIISLPVPLSAMGDWAGKAAIAAEDKRFFRHPGIDPIAIGRAALQNLSSGRIVSGASTISTLTVKLLHPPAPRNLAVKIRETVQALLLERRAAKERILEEYLNRAPFGGNLVGIEAASLVYFGKSARDLSLPEAALLAGIPKSPRRLRPDRAAKAAEGRRDFILQRMAAAGMIPADTALPGAAENAGDTGNHGLDSVGGASCPDPGRPGSRRRDLPFLAPHFCDLVLALRPDDKRIETTLDPRLQEMLESALAAHSERLRQRGVRGGAAVIIHVPSGEVRALVGSPDYRETEAGQVNCATAPRSPGSALKPFIYALAFERGLIAPAAVVADIPLTLGDWRPENFSRDFEGLVSVRDALVRSLNIPAVELVRDLTPEAVLIALKNLGLSTVNRTARDYGPGLAVGTCEVRLLDLAAAYACLAREGIFLPPRLTGGPPPPPRRIFSPAAAYLVSDILSGDERSLSVSGHAADTRLPRFAFKTGTSNGLKDAWALAWNPEYIVGVWFGNPDGRPSPALIGGEAAAPMAGEVFRRLYPGGDGPWYRRPVNVVERTVCARSGQPAGASCPARVGDLAIAGVSPSYPCRVHRPGETGEFWPEAITAYLKENGLEKCARIGEQIRKKRPAIVSPAAGQTFALLPELPAIPQGLTLSASAPEAERVFWFVDGALFAESSPASSEFWPLQRGEHVILCSDKEGNADRVRIRVE
jgi:penicillin-binding protein 1C